MADFLKIKYRNSCDLGGSVFSNPSNVFHYVLFINGSDLGEPTYEIIDEGREDGDKNFQADFKKLTKKFNFTLPVPEYIYDCLNYIALHDFIEITSLTDEASRVFDFKVDLKEWINNGGIAMVTVSFTVDYVINTGCCNNERVPYQPCVACDTDITVVDWLDRSDTVFQQPLASGVDNWTTYLIGDISGSTIINNILYYFSLEGKTWIPYTVEENAAICFTKNSINYKFRYDGQYWQPYQVLKSVVNSGVNIIIKGYCLPNTWAHVYISTNGINYTATGAITNEADFEQTGVTVSGLTVGVTYYFKFYLYNNNCNYGYSNVETIIKT
ncbi:MAG: hypothetical protein PHU98_06165 [Mariniphaga sp.]|nr:hypothetical protein [Mariniphaga sp.]